MEITVMKDSEGVIPVSQLIDRLVKASGIMKNAVVIIESNPEGSPYLKLVMKEGD